MAVKKELFGKNKKNEDVYKYILENSNGMLVSITDLGGTIVNIMVPDKNGKVEDVVLGYDTVQGYETNVPSFGAALGRYANRITNGSFILDKKEYKLDQNDDTNCLHGGFVRYNQMMYEAEIEEGLEESSVCFSRMSPDGEQGFPGNLSVSITYTLNDMNELMITYQGVCDEDTVINMTNHSYFNLGPGGNQCNNVLKHQVSVNAKQYTPLVNHIPTGEIKAVEGTPFDFRTMKELGRDLQPDENQPGFLPGYDDNFVIDNSIGDVVECAKMWCSETGRLLTVYTDQPGVQLYTAPELTEHGGKQGITYGPSSAACFETQNFPNAVNTKGFPSPLLKAGEEYRRVTIFAFSVEEA